MFSKGQAQVTGSMNAATTLNKAWVRAALCISSFGEVAARDHGLAAAGTRAVIPRSCLSFVSKAAQLIHSMQFQGLR
jgi:hypothetical protein